MSKVRDRGTTLDPSLVKAWASRMGINDLNKFKREFEIYIKDINGKGSSATSNAWKGKKMDDSQAKLIADFLECGLTDLMFDESRSLWDELTHDDTYKQNFFKLLTHNDASLELIESVRTISSTLESLDQVSITSGFRFKISGQEKDKVLIVIQSRDAFNIIAPINMPSEAGYSPTFSDTDLIYPQSQADPLMFKESMGLGWRKVTVIRSPYLKILRRMDVSIPITYTELEAIAHKIKLSHTGLEEQEKQEKKKKLAIESQEFVLI